MAIPQGSWSPDALTSAASPSGSINMAVEKVRVHAQRMEGAMDQDDRRMVFKSAADMLSELSAGQAPKQYSSLYAEVFTHLQQLPYFLEDHVKQGFASAHELYCMAQHAGRVLPRLYLMVTCASCAIKSSPDAVGDYLADLLEFCRGIQNPMRGLFLRSYLNTTVRSLLPDSSVAYANGQASHAASTLAAPRSGELGTASGSKSSASGTSISVDFLLRNFAEMNKLWTRMQRSMPASDARDSIRTQLAELVGKNLYQLSSLSGLTLAQYAGKVLPCICEQIVQCGDTLAQQYLMEIVIASFQDAYHVHTLRPLLDTCSHLEAGVEVHALMSLLMERLAEYARTQAEPVFADRAAFNAFLHAARDTASRHPGMLASGVVLMHLALSKFVAAVYDNDDTMFNSILDGCYIALRARGMVTDAKAEALLLALLQVPLQDFDLGRLMALDSFPHLLSVLQASKQRQVALTLVDKLVASGKQVDDATHVKVVLGFLQPLIDAGSAGFDLDAEERGECMVALSRSVRTLSTRSLPQLQELVTAAVRGMARLTCTGPLEALCHVFLGALQAHCPQGASVDIAHGFAFLHAKLVLFLEDTNAVAALRVLLAAAEAACRTQDVESAEQLLHSAVAVYHRYCALPPHAVAGLAVLVQGLMRVRSLPAQVFSGFVAQATQFATSLPVREDKVRMLCNTAHLHWQEDAVEPAGKSACCNANAAQEVLQDALRFVEGCEAKFRGEAWGNPAVSYMDVLDTAQLLKSRGCQAGDVETNALGHIQRLARDGVSNVLGSVPCWSDTIQARFVHLTAR